MTAAPQPVLWLRALMLKCQNTDGMRQQRQQEHTQTQIPLYGYQTFRQLSAKLAGALTCLQHTAVPAQVMARARHLPPANHQ